MATGLLDTLNDISTSLATLALQVRAESLAGLGSRNKVAEHVLLPVLRRVYGAPGLANANTLTANFPGIDLYDPSSGLGVQVTSESTAAKITETIETLAAGTLPLTRLVIALAANATPRSTDKTRTKWKAATQGRFDFEPETDVLAFDRLLARIQLLPPLEIAAVATELRALVRGTHMIHLLPHLRQQVEAQLAEEQRIARYIPDVFVETQDTKYQARCFAHPALFVRRIAGWFERQPFAGLNRLATMSGLPPVNTPSTGALAAADSSKVRPWWRRRSWGTLSVSTRRSPLTARSTGREARTCPATPLVHTCLMRRGTASRTSLGGCSTAYATAVRNSTA